MTLPQAEFDAYVLPDKDDRYFNERPTIRFDDLLPRHNKRPKLSLMISTYNRRSQLMRTLETLCRQTFVEFEVMLNDDGSTQDLRKVAEWFAPYLNIQLFQPIKTGWRSCPSKGFKTMLPFANGEVIAISHPEIMLDNGAIEFLYNSIMNPSSVDCDRYIVGGWDRGEPIETTETDGKYYWSELRPAFVDDKNYPALDDVDWHSSAKNIQKMENFWGFGGFSGRNNEETLRKRVFPWWFVGAARKDCPLWNDLPEFYGHGIIDAWMCRYRSINGFTDMITKDVMCYHQPHATFAFAPEGELIETRPANKIK
jgi:hypothetical protein